LVRRLCFDGHLPGNGPHEGDQFSGNRGSGNVGVFAVADESAKALAQPDLGFPPDVLNDLGQPFVALLDVR
jgi:hypothetical protein